ncbi:hypothetical protein KIN20_031957 [Parelaphostrongylus tenuis]|uniref:Uncharacterized protein n=1 Tax=Parelaphostrongylus tenuis TaxID=148309 RepID=A0AAD5WHP3_PARTN|nr:hypothetical protein KIN20_031957 [Parelaphostrongylus tenuis]
MDTGSPVSPLQTSERSRNWWPPTPVQTSPERSRKIRKGRSALCRRQRTKIGLSTDANGRKTLRQRRTIRFQVTPAKK